MCFDSGPEHFSDRLSMPLVQVEDLANGAKRGTYDFIIRQVTEKENVTPESLAARV